MAAAGSQLVFVPGCTHACGLHERARLMVVPLGARLPSGVTRLAPSSPSTARTSRGRLHATALACVSLRASTVGCASPYYVPASSRHSKTVAHVPATGAGDEETDVPEESDYTANVKDDGALARTSKDDSGGVFRDVKNVAYPKENNGSVVDPKENDGGADAKQNRGVFKDDPRIWMYSDKKQSDPGFARFWRDVGSSPGTARSRDEDTMQGHVDPSTIIGEVDRFLLDYDPVENMWGLAAVTHDEVILNEWKDAMCDASSLLHQAIWRGPLLAKHATELVLIGRAFGVVSKEAQLGFLQTRSIWKAIHGLKSMANVFLGQHTGYFPSEDSITKTTYGSDKVYFRSIGMDEKDYFCQLLDYYKSGFDSISIQMSGLFIDGD